MCVSVSVSVCVCVFVFWRLTGEDLTSETFEKSTTIKLTNPQYPFPDTVIVMCHMFTSSTVKVD